MQLKKQMRQGSNRFLLSFKGYVMCENCRRAYYAATETGQCNKKRCPSRKRQREE